MRFKLPIQFIKLKNLFLLFFLVNALVSFAQEPFLRKISFLEGLPTSGIYDMYVSKHGMLYLGTDRGLISFDGVRFLLYPFETNLSNSVDTIQEDANGVVYCKNFSNQIYFLKDGKLFLDATLNQFITKNKLTVTDFLVTSKNKILLTPNKIFKFKDNKAQLFYTSTFKLDKNDFWSMKFDEIENKLYVATLTSILTFKDNQIINKIPAKNGSKYVVIHNGKISYNTKSGETCLAIGTNLITLDLGLKNSLFNKTCSIENDLWLCSNNGIYKVDEQQKSIKNGFLKNNRISDIVQDKEGNYWISSLDNGLYLMPSQKIKSLNFQNSSSTEKISYNRIKKGSNKHLYIGTSNGQVIEFDENGKQILVYKAFSNQEIEFITLYKNLIITSICMFEQGNSIPISNKAIYFGKDVVIDNNGNFVVANTFFGGLMPFELKKDPVFSSNFSKYPLKSYGDLMNTLAFKEQRARTVFFDKNDNSYYIAFSDGLYLYDSNGIEKQIKSPSNKPIIASEILQDANGTIWIATTQDGIIQLKNKKVSKHITTQNLLSSNNCKRIEIDADYLWILTENGIESYHFKTGKIKNIGTNLCMKGIAVNDFFVDNNTVGIATNEGVFYFDKRVINQKSIPFFSINSIWVNKEKHPINDLDLAYNQNNIQIDFSTIHYKSLGDYQYEYRLLDQDATWQTLGSNATNIKYFALNSGNYTFQIRVKVGENYSPMQTIHFVIQKPFWLRYWFILLEIIALGLLIYYVYKLAVIRTKKKDEVKIQLALSQLTALRSQMNPHFMFNVLNSVQGLIYSNQKSKASEFLGKFSDLMRKILDASDKKEISVEKEFEMLDLYISLEKSRFDGDFEYTIQLPTNIDLKQYKIPSMIIQPYVENAIKHGLLHKAGAKKLQILGEIIDNLWCFSIEDNGVGREKSAHINKTLKSHQSFATEAIENRIELINKISSSKISLSIEDKMSNSNEPLGTKITVCIPVKKIY